MRAFEYVSPSSKKQVKTLLGENAAILAGGTDLLGLMKDDVVTPARLVNIKEIEALRGINYRSGNGLRIGALATIAELAEAKSELALYPALVEARNRAATCASVRAAGISATVWACFQWHPTGSPCCSKATTVTPRFWATTARPIS